MAIKVLIKRSLNKDVPEEMVQTLNSLVIQMRSHALKHHGYISGETLKCIDKPGEYIVISTWDSYEDWDKWLHSKERSFLQDKIDVITGTKTEYTAYVSFGVI